MGLIRIFESTQVALNLEFLSLIPESIDQSSFFIELAEKMELTFCEQIDNGCPVLLGFWDNVLKAEKKLEELLIGWEEERHFGHNPKSLPSSANLVLSPNKRKEMGIESIISETQCNNMESCVVETSIMPSSNCLTVSSDSILAKSSQLYIVTNERNQSKAPQLLYCNLPRDCCPVNTVQRNSPTEEGRKDLPPKIVENESGIKEIYVDISVDPIKTSSTKTQPTTQCIDDLKSSTNQHPLDKLCQLLCIEEDEPIDKRLIENKKDKREDKLPYKFFCDLCSFKAKRENHLLKHAKLHEKIKDLFYCDQCDFKTIRESVLRRHKMNHSGTELFCKLCKYKTDTEELLLKHIRIRHGSTNRKKVKCNYCDYIATNLRDLQKHKKLLHKSEIIPKFWKCSKCPYKSKLRAHLSRHENDVHGSLRQFLCHYCGKSFKRNDTLTQHKIIHGEINKTFTCQTCGKVCTSSVFFREHLASHTTERPFLCDVCGSSFKTRGATQRHKRAMHPANNSLLSCTQCGCIFKSRPDLNRHRKIHRCKTEATVVPGIISGANVHENVVIGTPITIQVVYTNQIDSNNQDVTIK